VSNPQFKDAGVIATDGGGQGPKKEAQPPLEVKGVKHIVAVALAMRGLKAGLLDADVYGPSQPRMLGVSGRPSSPDGQTILPLRNHGVTVMSLGLMMPDDEALIWRGDVLIVDLPPGTGDVQMTLSQKVNVTGAVIVSTPQDIALRDASDGGVPMVVSKPSSPQAKAFLDIADQLIASEVLK